MLDVKINYKRKYKNGLHCPFCSEYDETFEHTCIFKCNAGLRIPKQLKDFTLQSFSMALNQRSSSKSWDIFLVNTTNIIMKLCEGEQYNFQLNEYCYECVTSLLFSSVFNNLIC